jgi:hypothetical protein
MWTKTGIITWLIWNKDTIKGIAICKLIFEKKFDENIELISNYYYIPVSIWHMN